MSISGRSSTHDYYLGITGKQDRQVTVASGEARAWLPDSSSAVGVRSAPGVRSASKQQFLLEDPAQATQGAAQRSTGLSSSTSSVSLSGLKAKLCRHRGGDRPGRWLTGVPRLHHRDVLL